MTSQELFTEATGSSPTSAGAGFPGADSMARMKEQERDAVEAIIVAIQAGWKAGDGQQLAAPFAEHARFVSWDGQVLQGKEAIAEHHQRAFNGPLKGTEMRLTVDEVRALDGETLVAFTSGRAGPAGTPLDGPAESAQILVCRVEGSHAIVEAFQNTRLRPITDPQSAAAWRRFDQAWAERNT